MLNIRPTSQHKELADWFFGKRSGSNTELFNHRLHPVRESNSYGAPYDKIVRADPGSCDVAVARESNGKLTEYPLHESTGPAPEAAKQPKTQSAPIPTPVITHDWHSHAVVVFDGSFDTHIKDGKDYKTLTLREVFAALPASRDKEGAPAMIPSSYNKFDARAHDAQRANGQYVAIAGDIDKGNVPMEQVLALVTKFVGDQVAALIYSSSGASADNKKWRVLIPLASALPFAQWLDFQEAFFGLMEANGIVMDWALARAGQPVFLPNVPPEHRGTDGAPLFHQRHLSEGRGITVRDGMAAQALSDLKSARERDKAERQRAQQAARKAMQARGAKGKGDVIEAFNQAHTVEDLLTANGYERGRGDNWRSPYQSSKTFATKNFGDHWVSLSESDAGAGLGATCSAGCFGDAFDLYCHFNHGGDFKQAVREAARLLSMERPEPIPVDPSGILRNGASSPTSGEPTSSSHATDGANPSPTQEKPAGAASEPWPEPIDPFVEHPAPRFPVDHLPEAMAKYCHELAAGSGFDVGGYGFALLIAASNIIDHRARLNIGPMSVPAFLWGGLVDMSGGGKSPIMAGAMKFPQRIDHGLIQDSSEARKQFLRENAGKKPHELAELPQPPWKQLIATDTTVEALGELLKDNPAGMLVAPDELSAFVGQMDAYNKGSGKDRAAYLQMFDGGSKTINRKSALVPCIVENFSVGVLSGVQPEKLAEMFRKGGADGLFQRFLVYSLRRPGNVDYSAPLGSFTESNVGKLFDLLHTWTTQGLKFQINVDTPVLHLMQSYHQHIRTVALRTPDGRLREHLNKFPGFLARMLFALHCIECAAAGRFTDTIGVETFNRANVIAGVLFRHSEAVYEVVEHRGGGAMKLMKSACDAILSKGWQGFKRGDLTTTATGWRDAGKQEAEAALDLLEEFGWIRDVTPKSQAGKAGRRSSGAFVVNPQALALFVEHAKRIVNERAERYRAIQKVAPTRKSNPWE